MAVAHQLAEDEDRRLHEEGQAGVFEGAPVPCLRIQKLADETVFAAAGGQVRVELRPGSARLEWTRGRR
jgi:hypothetical protein